MTHHMDTDYICDSKKAVAKSLCSNVDKLSNEDAMVPVYGYRNDDGMMNNRHDDKYGREFGEYRTAKRNYTETHSKADKDRMDDHANAHIMNSISTIKEIWESANPELRRRIKNDMSNLLSNMNV